MPQRPDVAAVLTNSFEEEVPLVVDVVAAPGMGLLAKVMLLGTGMICAMVVAMPGRARRRLVSSMPRCLTWNAAEKRMIMQLRRYRSKW